jgi:hypothetical protein
MVLKKREARETHKHGKERERERERERKRVTKMED